MKNIAVSNETKKKLMQIKKHRNFKHYNALICWLLERESLLEEKNHKITDQVSVEKHSGFLRKKTDLADIRNRVDLLIKSKNPRGKASENQRSIAKVEILCLQCNGVFLLDESNDEMGIVCPHCNHRNDIIYLEDKEGEAI